ncbi:uracil/xanthine transporter [Aciduricibacillus chroicocephali]|uniref:Uracil/xanthine transporter n=1 Tax=Aciduricibacillus chroicocephali TaxID=3054939 RepID=A0ABY9KTG7_9BACI|nr:uracil/xanthine transporter [Bacillaceae bacterium 44XB]
MKELTKSGNWISGLQWLFFIFTNIVVIPITVGAAFGLSSEKIVSLLQLSFIVTGIACMLQALIGHRRALMEGQSGLWWGVILTLVTSASAQGVPLTELGGSLAIGVMISGVLTILIGITGMGPRIAKLFNPGVMGVFMFLFATQLCGIFLKGMLGIPFGNAAKEASINMPVAGLAIVIAILVILISIKAPTSIRRYGLLIGIVAGWIVYTLIFGSDEGAGAGSGGGFGFELFPFGKPVWNTGIIITTVLAGLLNSANTFGALKGTDEMYNELTTNKQYRASFSLTGIITVFAGVFGLVPYSPYVSSIGFLNQTGDFKRTPFILGGFMFFIMGVIPPVGHFFSLLPLSIGSAALFVSYSQIFNSSLRFFQQVTFNTLNVYRSAVPLFVGIIIMTMPSNYFATIPDFIRPLVSSGLLVGIILALFLENLFPWDRLGTSEQKVQAQKSKEERLRRDEAAMESN